MMSEKLVLEATLDFPVEVTTDGTNLIFRQILTAVKNELMVSCRDLFDTHRAKVKSAVPKVLYHPEDLPKYVVKIGGQEFNYHIDLGKEVYGQGTGGLSIMANQSRGYISIDQGSGYYRSATPRDWIFLANPSFLQRMSEKGRSDIEEYENASKILKEEINKEIIKEIARMNVPKPKTWSTHFEVREETGWDKIVSAGLR